jgi:hypothetical protein
VVIAVLLELLLGRLGELFGKVFNVFVRLNLIDEVSYFFANIFKFNNVSFKRNSFTLRIFGLDTLIGPLEDLHLNWRLHVVVELPVREHVDVQIILFYAFQQSQPFLPVILFFLLARFTFKGSFNVDHGRWVSVSKHSQVAVFDLELELPYFRHHFLELLLPFSLLFRSFFCSIWRLCPIFE